jgi:hypothetical protein
MLGSVGRVGFVACRTVFVPKHSDVGTRQDSFSSQQCPNELGLSGPDVSAVTAVV